MNGLMGVGVAGVRRSQPGWQWLLAGLYMLPLAFMAVFFVYPLLSILRVSFSAEYGGLGAAQAALVRGAFWQVAWFTTWQAALSTLLTVLADTPEGDVYSPEGKARLQVRLTAAINKVLTDTEGFGGIDRVYFKSFLVQ